MVSHLAPLRAGLSLGDRQIIDWFLDLDQPKLWTVGALVLLAIAAAWSIIRRTK